MKSEQLRETFGSIDIYLFDQLAKGTYDECQSILDAGCGTGRNLLYFLQSGANVFTGCLKKNIIRLQKFTYSFVPAANQSDKRHIGGNRTIKQNSIKSFTQGWKLNKNNELQKYNGLFTSNGLTTA